MAKKELKIVIPAIKISKVEIGIEGLTPLLCHAFSERTKTKMVDKQTGKATQGREMKVPERDFQESLYWLDKSGNKTEAKTSDPTKHKYFGFPAIAIKKCMVRAAIDVGITMEDAKRMLFIEGTWLKLSWERLVNREDRVVISKKADIRYRGEFHGWSIDKIIIKYNSNRITKEQIVNLLNTAGFGVGIGDWRTQCGGNHGAFRVK